MKLLLFACLLGFAAANFIQKAAPAVDKSVLAFMEGSVNAGSLSEALGVDDAELEQLADDAESGIASKVREALQEWLEKIKDHVENGKEVGKVLLEKVKELREKLKELGAEDGEKAKELLKKIKEKAREILKHILEKLGLGKRNLDDSMDHVARMKFKEIIEMIKEKLTSNETIEKIRIYLKELSGRSEIIKKLKDFVERLQDGELREIISHLFDHTNQRSDVVLKGETWDKVKNFFKDLKIKIQDHSKKFGEWVKSKWNNGLDKLKEKYGAVKAIALEFIANSKDMSSEMAREALEFFRPYKDDLGALWKQIVDASKEAIGKF